MNTQQVQQQQQDNCAPAASQFTKCMDDHNGNLQICNWYLEQLVRFISLGYSLPPLPRSLVLTCCPKQKACQAAAKQY